MPSIEIKKSKVKLSSPLPPSKTLIKYKDLLEGIGHQVISKIIQPTVYHYNYSGNSNPSPTLKQLTGAVTLLYTLVILVISFGMFLVYMIWPDEENILKKLMLTALPFMLIFTLSILICYFYINRKSFCFNLQNSTNNMSSFFNISNKFNDTESSNRSHNTSGSSENNNNHVITSNSQTSINIYHDTGIHTGINHRTTSSDSACNNPNTFERAFDESLYRYENGQLPYNGHHHIHNPLKNPNIVNVPMWQAPDISDMKDKQTTDYQRMAAEQKQLSSTLEFLKYKD